LHFEVFAFANEAIELSRHARCSFHEQTGRQGTALAGRPPETLAAPCRSYSRQVRGYRDFVPVLSVVPVSDPGRDCCELGIFDCPSALWIDTCTLSPLLRDVNDCSGTFSRPFHRSACAV
jgi:hypothetical protein